jgi:hypothetical protein
MTSLHSAQLAAQSSLSRQADFIWAKAPLHDISENTKRKRQIGILVIGFNQQNTRYRLMCLLWDIGHGILGA